MDAAWHKVEQFALTKSVGEYFASLEMHQRDGVYAHLVRAFRPRLLDTTVFASLNYDTLFEQAVEGLPLAVDYGFGRRPNGGNHVTVLKLHGSSNFFPQVPDGVFLEGTVSIDNRGLIGGRILHVPPKESRRRYRSRNQVECTPAMSLITPGKPMPVGEDDIAELRQRWQTWLSETDLIILIGVRPVPTDEHIWGPIVQSRADVWYIGGNPEWLLNNTAGRTTWLSKSFDSASLQRIRKGLREKT